MVGDGRAGAPSNNGSDDRTKQLHQLHKLCKMKRHTNPGNSRSQKPIAQTSVCETSDLERKAREQILEEVSRGKRRYHKIGPQGWKRPACLATDKKFLERILQSTRSKSNMTGKKSQDQKAQC